MATKNDLIAAAMQLREDVEGLQFGDPVAYVYNPLVYAWAPHENYLERWGAGCKRVIFLGMNPGPWGMAQVGVPFGEISYVRDWLKIAGRIERPASEHPDRPVHGFECERSEVSGRRLWGYFSRRYGTPSVFFQEHFVANYCPLMLAEESGRNRTPDKLHADEQRDLFAACDEHLRRMVRIQRPQWVIGVGAFAADRAAKALAENDVRVGRILHPSPASPAANRGWAKAVEHELREQGV